MELLQMEEREPARINTRISADTNDWLDRRSKEVALSKSALINIAVENYRREVETVKVMPDIVKKLKEIGVQI